MLRMRSPELASVGPAVADLGGRRHRRKVTLRIDKHKLPSATQILCQRGD
jgi:hypothetical protein